MEIKELKDDLSFLETNWNTIVYGSYVEGGMRPDSDIDVAVISYNSEAEDNLKLQKELLGKSSLKYEIRVFELLPIYIKIAIIENYEVLFGDPLEISKYFYHFRKKWDECKRRILSNQFSSYRERLSIKNNVTHK